MFKSLKVLAVVFSALCLLPVFAFADALDSGQTTAPAKTVSIKSRAGQPLDGPAAVAATDKLPPADSKPAAAETKPATQDVKPAQPADTKVAAPGVKPAQPVADAAKTVPATNAAPAAAQGQAAAEKLQGPDGQSPTEFFKNGDTALVDTDTDDAEAKTGEKPPAEVAPAADLFKHNDDSGNLLSPIESNIRYFSVTVKNHFTKWLSRSGKYMTLMKGILRENYLPEDLVFLSLIESGFNPKAYSWAKASGPWQFIKGTAQKYGLRVDRWVDERRDPIKSTQAAARYLKDLYGMFGSWPLALASYNAGEGNVARAVTRNGSLDFWELRKTRYLPSETKDYVPKFVAAKMIAQNPGEYGFSDVEYEQPFEFDEVTLDRCTDLGLVAKCCGVPVEEIKDLNPELIRGCTPPNNGTYTLRIPKGKKDEFLAAYNALPDNEKETKPARIAGHRRGCIARRGDTLEKIAGRLDIPVDELAAANHLSTTARLRKGQRIRIPASEAGGTMVASDSSGDGSDRPRATGRSSRAMMYYRVKKGDTLASVARRHGMTQVRLARLNGISSHTRLRAGQRLAISSRHARTASASPESERTPS